MELEKAKEIAKEYINRNQSQYLQMEVVGSIRRVKPEVRDIDIVAIPKFSQDKKILRFDYKGIQIDIYFATKDNYECLRLIRTGSAEHNRMLCSLALRKGWKLKASGEGLCAKKEKIHTKEGILKALLGKYIEPKDREDKKPDFSRNVKYAN